jgi:hypothetical protein
MPRKKEPVALIERKGKTHLTRAEKMSRRESEVNLPELNFDVPDTLHGCQIEEFKKIALYLMSVNAENNSKGGGNIYNGMDSEAIAQYIICKDYSHDYQRKHDTYLADMRDMYDHLEIKRAMINVKDCAAQHRYYCEQARKYASDLGLTVTARMKIVLPGAKDDAGEYGGF